MIKKCLLALLFCFASGVALFAQDSIKHMEFRGIPIDGDMSSFVNQLNQLGYTGSIENGMAMLTGKFGGKDVTVAVYASERSSLVYQVIVVFPNETSWYSLKSYYRELKNSLSTKYGAPYNSNEYFSSPYHEGDGYEMSAVRLGKVHYVSRFSTPSGQITLTIFKDGAPMIAYEDKINAEKKKTEEKSSIINDL